MHLFLLDEGFYPGLPYHVIQILEPTHLIAISARPEEIYNRRMKDDTRTRDKISIEGNKKGIGGTRCNVGKLLCLIRFTT